MTMYPVWLSLTALTTNFIDGDQHPHTYIQLDGSTQISGEIVIIIQEGSSNF